jgi:hypothetical protein
MLVAAALAASPATSAPVVAARTREGAGGCLQQMRNRASCALSLSQQHRASQKIPEPHRQNQPPMRFAATLKDLLG